MKELSYTTVDKSDWGDGPWQNEPDKLQFTDELTGMPCLIVRNHGGSLCGYVGVNPDHVAYQQHYDSPVLRDVTVHGGLTFSDLCSKRFENEPSQGICHLPEPGEEHHVWWLGFDCAHLGDISPGMDATTRSIGLKPIRYDSAGFGPRDTYKDMAYVKAECARLAAQLYAMRPPLLEAPR